MEWNWKLLYKNKRSSTWKKHNNLESLLKTKPRSSNIMVKPRSLLPGFDYVLSIEGYQRGASLKGRAEYKFTVNYSPSNGTCKVNTTTGKALIDTFFFSCRDWIDKDGHLPLLYEFSYKDANLDFERLILSTDYPQALTELPVGDRNNNFSLLIVIKIRDRYGAVTRRTLNLTVCKNNV